MSIAVERLCRCLSLPVCVHLLLTNTHTHLTAQSSNTPIAPGGLAFPSRAALAAASTAASAAILATGCGDRGVLMVGVNGVVDWLGQTLSAYAQWLRSKLWHLQRPPKFGGQIAHACQLLSHLRVVCLFVLHFRSQHIHSSHHFTSQYTQLHK